MNFVQHFEVEGFWGDRKVSLPLYEDLNFLIGENGSGKTTVINLLSAVLRADIPTLYSIDFEKARVKLKTRGTNKKPVVEVAKVVDADTNSFELKYTVKEKTTDKGYGYTVEAPFEDRIYKDPRYARLRGLHEDHARLGRILAGVVEVNWLSVHRSAPAHDRRRFRDDDVEPSVDVKIREISRSFSSYFSHLSSRAAKEGEGFQEQVFLSLLEQETELHELFAHINKEPADKDTLVDILKGLGVSSRKANDRVASHSKRFRQARDNWLADESRFEDAVTLSNTHRLAEMVKKWRRLQGTRSEIFRPRDQFEEIINSLFSGKKLHFDDRNTPKVHLGSRGEVDIGVLSSGEKQLFILLGEAVLQEQRPVVFISDEPELSLHVNWQNSLFKNVRALNGSCQIISATHSPDIVGGFRKRVIKIKDCFK